MDLWIIFVTGLTVGGLTCLAVQGGLLASLIATREEEEIKNGINRKDAIFPTLAFLTSKFIVYTLLGFLLGLFGDIVSINQTTQNTMQFAAGLYMVAVALNLLNVHPIFRYTVLQSPRFLTRLVRKQSKNTSFFAPAFLGALTIFIPCGTTLAMETLAIASGSPIMGALIMGVFILGTTPLFFGVGFATSIAGDNFREKFLKIAALGVLYLGLTSINGALVATGSTFTIQSVVEDTLAQINPSLKNSNAISYDSSVVKVVDGVQTVDMTIYPNAYSPNYIQVKSGFPVKLNLSTSDKIGCTSAFQIPSLGISKQLIPSSTDSIEFIPQDKGKIAFTCSMGMYSGVIEVI